MMSKIIEMETNPDYLSADRILEDGDTRWFRERIALALAAERAVERERCEIIVQEARLGEKDSDLRSILYAIKNP